MKGKVRLRVEVDYAFSDKVKYVPHQARVVSGVLEQPNSFANQMNYLMEGFEAGLFVQFKNVQHSVLDIFFAISYLGGSRQILG